MAMTRGIIWPEPTPVGTLFVDPETGDTYRYTDFGETWTGKPTYTVVLTEDPWKVILKDSLPEGAVCVYFPYTKKVI